MRVIVTDQRVLELWFLARKPLAASCGDAGYVGLMDTRTGTILAVARYDSFNGVSVSGHIESVPGKNWLTPEFLWFTFYYPFVQLGVSRITALVPANAKDAIRFDEKLGFVYEAALVKAHPDGDLLVYRMFKEDCHWLTLNENCDEKNPSSQIYPFRRKSSRITK